MLTLKAYYLGFAFWWIVGGGGSFSSKKSEAPIRDDVSLLVITVKKRLLREWELTTKRPSFFGLLLGLTILISGCNPEVEIIQKDPSRLPGFGDGPSFPGSEIPQDDNGDTPDITPPGPNLVSITDTYTQGPDGREAPHKVDILWVIDNSGSMRDNQDNLAENLGSFIELFLNADLVPNFRMAVVTTDPRSNRNNGDGKLVDGVVLTKEQAVDDRDRFLAEFQDLIRVGTNGSGNESGLNNMLRATERTENNIFFREDAILAVNILSDEYDYSVNLTGNPVSHFVNQVRAFKGEERLIINSIVNLVDHARYDTRGEQQIQASEMTNGVVADIRGNFRDALNNIGESLIILTSSFPLTEEPHDSSIIQVFVDTTEVFAWSFNEELNTVIFDNPPAEGAVVEIQYFTEVNLVAQGS